MKSQILISFILITTFSFAQLGSTMFGLARNSPSGVFLATMDPVTGIATNISQSSISASINLTGAALNPYTNQFCFFGDNGLKSIDLSTGLISNTATINNPNGTGYFDLFRFNTSDSLMYGLSRRNIPNPQTGGLISAMFLATIDANTGTITEISPSSIGQGFAFSGSAIDPHQMVFYYSTGAQLVGLDMYTGGIFTSPTLTYPNGGQTFDNFTYSCADTALYGLIRTNYYSQFYDPQTMLTTQVFDSAAVHLGKVNALTGEVIKVSTQSLGVTAFSVNGSSTIDPVNMIYYFISGSGTGLAVYGVSLQTGLVVSQGTISNANALYFDMMRIQSDCYESRPTRVAPSASLSDPLAKQPTIQVFPNPTTDVVQIIANQNIDKELIQLIDVCGKVVVESLFSGTQTQLDLSKLAPGTYYLKSNNLLDLVYKIVKE
jgi:hypothetical protein